MSRTLNKYERRVLGVLLEKALSQPGYYPMTVNSIVTGCNQKTTRDPVMELDESTVMSALDSLRSRKLVSIELPGAGSRVTKFRHEVNSAFGWDKREKAILAELLLRGPQTVGELRGHASRMTHFESMEEVEELVEKLTRTEPPTLRSLGKSPGQSSARYAHTFYPENESPVASRYVETTVTREEDLPFSGNEDLSALQEEVRSLREKVTDLERQIQEIRARLPQ